MSIRQHNAVAVKAKTDILTSLYAIRGVICDRMDGGGMDEIAHLQTQVESVFRMLFPELFGGGK